ncbi:unnamed protein product (macronuclear) [Paramecium tetraurelia]|uniref:ADP/ATP translocase n=1 Tax=Paramecium tetraurelia TaxID=5888 RepID=A0DZ51_PARTE|nr:uncharacterized protein GSPATT00003287001 [Paramecium tetraurelia]CAK88318.1 unnamed protein product [Paramecium tetraurelia]|eukprot:XP_001455715.1 hypothetical protein (macronuclear) [Paramecium tetraurelia strain d4-2]
MSSSKDAFIPQIFIDFIIGVSSGVLPKLIVSSIYELQFLIMIGYPYKKQNQPTGILDGCKQVIMDGTLLRQLRKNTRMVRFSLIQGFNFSIYNALNRQCLSKIDVNKQLIKYFGYSLLNGGIAGTVTLPIFYTLNFSRVRLANNLIKAQKEKQKLWFMLRDMYKGFGMTAICSFIYKACYFGGYDTGQYIIWGDQLAQRNELNLSNFLLAQLVVSSSELLVHPLDTVRKKIMLNCQQQRLFDHIFNSYQKEGIRGVFKGYIPINPRQLVPSTQLLIYDKLQQKLNFQAQY